MNDPHVVALIYHIEHGDSVNYEDAKSFVCNEPAFQVKIKDEEVCFELKEHYATESEARESIDEYIRVWELDAGLRHGPDYFKLKFDRTKIEDRNPTPGVIDLRATFAAGNPEWSADIIIAPSDYPSPLSGLSIDADVQTMYDRYMNYRRKREPLVSMANLCLTILEDTAKTRTKKKMGKRQAAAQYYHISKKVLGRFAQLSAEKGGPFEARKSKGVGNDLTEQERLFLQEAVVKMIYRVAEKVNDPTKNFSQITLNDLPSV